MTKQMTEIQDYQNFPERIDIILENLMTLEEKLGSIRSLLIPIIQKEIDNGKTESELTLLTELLSVAFEVDEIKEEIKRNQSELKRYRKLTSNSDEDIDIEEIRLTPIIEVARLLGAEIDTRNKCKCLIHNEKTASMSFHTNLNIFNCFGCGAKGDVIKLVELVNKCTFLEAINFIKR